MGIIIWTRDMIPILILALQVLSAVGRPQNDGLIHTDLTPERRDNVPAELVDLLMNGTARQAESRAVNSCGCAEVSSSERIVGGSEVSPKYKYPYQIYFQANGYMCGGTIINKRYVLTAMHCLYDQSGNEHPVSKTSVIIGEHNLDDGINEGGQYIQVEEFIKRSDYDSTNIVNDIAILKLKSDITFTDNVKPACLPTDTSKTYVGRWGIVSGYGGTVGYAYGEEVQQQSSTHALKSTRVKILGSFECSQMTSGDSATRMCGFADGTDSCQGDSGGPMTVVEDGKYTVVGVVSYGSGCASTTPGVYARVTNYLSWISSNTQDGDCEEGSTDTSTGGSTDTQLEDPPAPTLISIPTVAITRTTVTMNRSPASAPRRANALMIPLTLRPAPTRISMTTVGITRITVTTHKSPVSAQKHATVED